MPVPRPGPGEVLVRVDASGVCAADRAMWDGTGPWPLRFPFTPGHEFTGTVVELGDGADERHGLAVGDRTVAELNIARGDDFFRRRGLYHLADDMDVLGATLDGGWADFMLYPRDAVVHRVPDALSVEAACYASRSPTRSTGSSGRASASATSSRSRAPGRSGWACCRPRDSRRRAGSC